MENPFTGLRIEVSNVLHKLLGLLLDLETLEGNVVGEKEVRKPRKGTGSFPCDHCSRGPYTTKAIWKDHMKKKHLKEYKKEVKPKGN